MLIVLLSLQYTVYSAKFVLCDLDLDKLLQLSLLLLFTLFIKYSSPSIIQTLQRPHFIMNIILIYKMVDLL